MSTTMAGENSPAQPVSPTPSPSPGGSKPKPKEKDPPMEREI